MYGQIAAANALSDVYAMGGKPLTALNLVGYPDDQLSMDWLGRILAGGAERCAVAKCTIVGGHTVRDTEIKFGLSVTGTVHPERVLTNANAKVGDVLILTKPLGTGFVTTASKRESCPPELLAATIEGMVQLNSAGCEAMLAHGAHAATDVTGFGLAGHAYEMASGSGHTLVIELSKLPLIRGLDTIDIAKFRTRAVKSNRAYTDPHTQMMPGCDERLLDVFYDPQTSGGLLICLPPERVEGCIAQLKATGALATAIIGHVAARGDKALVVRP